MAEYRNSIRSKKLIREAFAKILEEKKDINKISVKEIVERADISKSTFYCHYQDIYAVIEEFEDEIFTLLENTMDEFSKRNNTEFMPYINKVLLTLKENEEIYKMLFKADFPIKFIDKLKNMCFQRLNKYYYVLKLANDPNTRKAEINFLTNGIIYLVVDYFRGDLDLTLDDIAVLINQLLLKIAK